MMDNTGSGTRLPRSRAVNVSRRALMRSAAATLAATAVAGIARPAFAQRGPDRTLIKGGVVLSFDRGVGDFEKADVLIEGKKIAAVRPGHQRRRDRDRRVAHDRAAGLHRHAPSFLSERAAQRAGERRARRLFPRHFRRRHQSLPARGCLCRQSDRRVAFDRCRHHHDHGPVAGLQHARAQRRLDQGPQGFRRARDLRLFARLRRRARNIRTTSSGLRSSISRRPISW